MTSLKLCCLLVFLSFVSSCANSTRTPPYESSPKVTPYEVIEQPVPVAPPFMPYKPSVKSKGIIVLDAGHGGKDLGTVSTIIPNFAEKTVNLQTTQMVSQFLKQMGYQIIFTRSQDVFISLDKRAAFANERHPNVFVSIHFNSAPTAKAEGIEVFYYKNDKNKARVECSKALAQSILDAVIKNTQAKSRGVKHGDLAVIRETKMPAILIEGGFLTNDSETKKIKEPHYLKRLALGIAQGIDQYLRVNKLKS